MTVILC